MTESPDSVAKPIFSYSMKWEGPGADPAHCYLQGNPGAGRVELVGARGPWDSLTTWTPGDAAEGGQVLLLGRLGYQPVMLLRGNVTAGIVDLVPNSSHVPQWARWQLEYDPSRSLSNLRCIVENPWGISYFLEIDGGVALLKSYREGPTAIPNWNLQAFT